MSHRADIDGELRRVVNSSSFVLISRKCRRNLFMYRHMSKSYRCFSALVAKFLNMFNFFEAGRHHSSSGPFLYGARTLIEELSYALSPYVVITRSNLAIALSTILLRYLFHTSTSNADCATSTFDIPSRSLRTLESYHDIPSSQYDIPSSWPRHVFELSPKSRDALVYISYWTRQFSYIVVHSRTSIELYRLKNVEEISCTYRLSVTENIFWR